MKNFLVVISLLCCGALCARAQQTTVSGTLTSAQGSPISIAHVHVMGTDSYKAKPQSFSADDKGHFSFSLPNGWYRVQFSGVDYAAAPERPMEIYCCGQPVEINAQLAANAIAGTIDSVKIITDLTQYDFTKAVTMKKQSDGTFTADFTTSKPALSYQVLVFGGESQGEHSVNGTMSDSYEYDGGGDYRSIVNVKNGAVNIIFDPKKAPSVKGAGKVEFTDDFSKSVKAILSQEDADNQVFFKAYGMRKAGKPITYNPKEAHEKVRKDIAAETNPILREIQMLRYLQVGYFSEDTTGVDVGYVKEIIAAIPAFSSVWGHHPQLVGAAMNFLKDKKYDYAKQVLKENASVYVKSEVLSSLLERATNEKDDKVAATYYTQLMKEYPDTYAARNAEKRFNPNRKIKEGNIIPNFAFDGVDEESGKKITPASLKGKWVLIDNWATWCGPCVAEMPALHSVYEKFKNKNFVVLSVSFDRQAADVTKFRGGKFKMPWMHSFSEGVWESEAAKVFEVTGIPKPILIDPKGKIVAMEEELRSENLEKTLAKYVK